MLCGCRVDGLDATSTIDSLIEDVIISGEDDDIREV